MRPAAESSRTREKLLLSEYATTRSPALREELVRLFMPLARSLAMRYRRGSEPIEDLVQIASLGLVKAIDGFDPQHARGFTAYAVPTILGELRRHFRDSVWIMRLPRGLQELTMAIDKASEQLTDELGRSPTAPQVAAHIGVGTEEVLEGLTASRARRMLSFEAPHGHDEDALVLGDITGVAEPGYDRVESDFACDSAGLDEREWRVLRMRFVDDLTQLEIGRRLGVSQMQISRVSRRALWKLLAAVRGERIERSAPLDLLAERS